MSLEGRLAISDHGYGVEFTFTAENVSADPVELTFTDGRVADVAVYQDGVEVWRWSDGRAFTQAVEHETRRPGESVVHEVTWTDAPPGEYVAEAELAAENLTLTVREPFRVSET